MERTTKAVLTVVAVGLAGGALAGAVFGPDEGMPGFAGPILGAFTGGVLGLLLYAPLYFLYGMVAMFACADRDEGPALEQAVTFFWASLVFSLAPFYFETEGGFLGLPITAVVALSGIAALTAWVVFGIKARKPWARWVMLLLSVFWIPSSIISAILGFDSNAIITLLHLAAAATQALGIWILFTAPVRHVFRRSSVEQSPRSLSDQLRELADLREQGLINDDDFEHKKQRLLR